jgi:aryl-alcohol dehydrogenase-like predicted oxidoreductase
MRYVSFGRLTGLRVSELGLGTSNFGTAWGTGADRAGAARILDGFADAGGVLIDTADNYQEGQAETLLGELLGRRRDQFVLTSKFGRGAGRTPHLSVAGNSRRSMLHSVEASLKRLQTDRLDIYWAHYEDGLTPIEEIVEAFDDLRAAGKILYGGLSNFPAWRVARAQTIAELRGLSPISGIQVEHSLVERTAERELLPMAEALGIGVALYSPLGGGLLTGKYRGGAAGRQSTLPGFVYREDSPAMRAAVQALIEVADEAGTTPARAALAWQRECDRRSTTSLVTLIGPRTPEQLGEYLAALDIELSDGQFEQLTTATAITRGAPYDTIGGPPDLGDRGRVRAPTVPVS